MNTVRFAVFRKSDGAIQGVGVCPEDMVAMQAGDEGLDVCVVEEDISDTTHYIIDGIPVELPGPSSQEIIDAVFDELRSTRDSLLRGCGWTQENDSPLDAPVKQAWAVYRQALRDLPQTHPNILSIDEVVWPTPPA